MRAHNFRFPLLLMPALLVAACGEDAPSEAGSGTDVEADAAADVGSDGADIAVDATDASDVPDAEPPTCVSGLDFDGDGVCDREAADWSRGATLPERGDRADIYRLGENRNIAAAAGVEYMLVWPVDVSGLLIPWRPLERTLDPSAEDDLTLAYQQLLRGALGFGTTDEMFEWLGLAEYDGSAEAMPGVPWPEWLEPGDPMGFGLVERPEGEGLTFSCATCHTADVFGRTVLGATNRQAQANEFFHNAGEFFPDVSPEFFGEITGANEGELELFARAQVSIGAVATRVPQVRGLDTSLAQVSLSLARRAEDEFATRSEEFERRPRPNDLQNFVADSKPAVWWTMRYKTRWLSDGSIVSGNPVFTNFLWNELGRGTDLIELQQWLVDNRQVADELTALLFATESPRWEDWFDADSIDTEAAQRGHLLFEATCAECHGSYEKGWDAPGAGELDQSSLIANVYLDYPRQTPVFNVGTDPQRAAGMGAFAGRLNELAISVAAETVVEVQDGYVPPPLDGIWIRYPYLHNGSVPTLCDMLLPAAMRTPVFWMGPSSDAETDFDPDCVGFPVGEAVPESWYEDARNEYDTTRPGLGNFGHDEWLTNEDGSPRYSADERADLIEFLKTL